ncbi:hypothetical protein NLI96_g3551 [Meripilus lineatus]|uniref:Uncharacterized protein n=1 Tax=Meripilus lineatus TaxID=2056292 RepID=A0AAD5YIZ5_9APHY|nr:hypothetical protein NLI96_g3551 [Physisporinus lineatus]
MSLSKIPSNIKHAHEVESEGRSPENSMATSAILGPPWMKHKLVVPVSPDGQHKAPSLRGTLPRSFKLHPDTPS